MTHKQEVQYLRIALSFCGITSNDCTAECIVELHRHIKMKEGEFTLADGMRIQRMVETKYSHKPKRPVARKKASLKKK